MDGTLERITYRFRRPVMTAYGTLEQRDLLRLRLETDGATGIGEAAPLPAYDGVTLDQASEALAPVLADPSAYAEGAATVDLPQAAAALDVALLDFVGRSAQTPVAALLAEAPAAAIPVNATIVAKDPKAAASEAADARAAAFICLTLQFDLEGA